jgi:hypothetical protein
LEFASGVQDSNSTVCQPTEETRAVSVTVSIPILASFMRYIRSKESAGASVMGVVAPLSYRGDAAAEVCEKVRQTAVSFET